MADLRITFTLRDQDLKYFRRVMREAVSAATERSEEEIIRGALRQAAQAKAARPPSYVLDRIATLETIAQMVQDKDWVLPGSVRPRVLTALAYFLNPLDLIPDHIPALGFLDDAIMIELISQDLRHEVEGYQDFRRFRDREQGRVRAGSTPLERRLAHRRKQLRARIQGRRVRDADRGGRRFRLF